MRCTTHARRRTAVAMAIAITFTLPLSVAAYDWQQFDGDSTHRGNNTQETAITAANVSMLRSLFHVSLPNTADSAPVALTGVTTMAGVQDLVFVTTHDGHLIAVNAHTGATAWSIQHGPGTGSSTCHINNGATVCYTTASPAIDPNRLYIYAYGLDGMVHKHQVGDGTEILTGGWPEVATLKGFDEKGSSALSIATDAHSNTYLYVANGGYPGDNGDYQGHITAINLATGTQKVFNTLCSNQTVHFVEQPGSPDCVGHVQSAVWSRPGVIYNPGTDHIYIATGNGDYDANTGGHEWGDSVLALNPDGSGNGSGTPLDSYTPTEFQSLQNGDTDLGSTAPAILPTPPGCAVPQLAVQGGKDGKLRLINLANLSGAGGPGHTGGEMDLINVAVGGVVLSQPAVWVSGGVTRFYVTTASGILAYQLNCPSGGQPTMQLIWQHASSGSYSSPLVANGVLYSATNHTLTAYNPIPGNVLWTGTIGTLHWESPIVANGILYMPDEQGFLSAFTLPPSPSPQPNPHPSGAVKSIPTPIPQQHAGGSIIGTPNAQPQRH